MLHMDALLARNNGSLDSWTLDDSGNKIGFTYNSHLQSLRIFSGSPKVFLLDQTGIFFSKISIVNEYNQPAGELIYENQQHDAGIVWLEGRKYRFRKTGDVILISDRKRNILFGLSAGTSSIKDSNERAALIFAALYFHEEKALIPA